MLLFSYGKDIQDYQQHIIPLSIPDKQKGIQLVTLLAQMEQYDLCSELQQMLHQNVKLEIQSLQSPGSFILSRKLISAAISEHCPKLFNKRCQ